jgi:glycosyltransferase involved in cell wall biosynthesis
MNVPQMKREKADVSVIIPVYNSGKEAFRAVSFIAVF